jgi:hypothetical protein
LLNHPSGAKQYAGANGLVAPARTAAAATAEAAFFARLGFVDRQAASIVLLIVQAFDGRAGGVVIRHFDEAEAFAAARIAIHDDLGATNGAEGRKQLFQAAVRDPITQISNVQSLTHKPTPKARSIAREHRPHEKGQMVARQEGKAREKQGGRTEEGLRKQSASSNQRFDYTTLLRER